VSDNTDIAARTQRFNEISRAHSRHRHRPRHAKTMPMKDGIIELRQNGVPFALIRKLVATVCVRLARQRSRGLSRR
jgi:hypothetical protein